MIDRITHPECDLLVVSTDRYLSEAALTISQLKKIGIAHRFDCHLLLGEVQAEFEGFEVLRRKHRGTWSSELRDGLLQLKKPYVLMWLDDLTPISVRSADKIVDLIDKLIEEGGNYLRLCPTPLGNGPVAFAGVRRVLPGELYRTSTVLVAWRRDALLELLDDGETAWQFEFAGSIRSDNIAGFFACETPQVEFVNLVIKGLVDPRAEKMLQRHGIDTKTITRDRMSSATVWTLRFKEFRSKLLKLVPWQFRTRLRHIFSTNPSPR